MKVDPNAPAYPVEHVSPNPSTGIPIRLAIAAQIMAGAAGNPTAHGPEREALIAISWADALIAEYNRGQA